MLQLKSLALNKQSYTLAFFVAPCSTIYEHGFVSVVPQKIAVYLYRVYNKSLYLHGVSNLNVYNFLVFEIFLAEPVVKVYYLATVLERACFSAHIATFKADDAVGQHIVLLL